MKAWMTSTVIVVVGLFVSASASAQCNKGAQAEGSGCGKSAIATAAGGACCQKSGVKGACSGPFVAGMPVMYMKVADKTTEYPKEAATLAGGDESKIRYIVADKEYGSKDEAAKVYQTALDEYLTTVTTVRYAVGEKCVGCPDSAAAMAKAAGQPVQFRVASYTFADKAEAEKAATAAREAADKVVLKCVVDGKEMVCEPSCKGAKASGATCGAKGEPTQATAGTTCNKDGKGCEYVIGELRTPCATTAQIMLVRSKISAAVQAAEQVFAQKNGSKEVAATGL